MVALLALGACNRNEASGNGTANAAPPAAANGSATVAQNTSAAPGSAAPTSEALAWRRVMATMFPAAAPFSPQEATAITQRPTRDFPFTEAQMAAINRGVASGDPAWLAIVPQLRRATTGDASDSLTTSLTSAVATNPADALKVIASLDDGGAEYCWDGGWEWPAADKRAYYAAAIQAVERVSDPALQQLKAQCLAKLRENQPKA
jgi:hypothetical protein